MKAVEGTGKAGRRWMMAYSRVCVMSGDSATPHQPSDRARSAATAYQEEQ